MSKSAITIRIGIWGIQRAGITTYITMLYNCLQKEHKYFPSVTADPYTLDTITENLKKISQAGIFPDSTKLEKEFYLQTYTLGLNNNSKLDKIASKIVLEFIDFPSNYYERINSLKDVKVVVDNSEISYYEYFNSCNCFLFLLDKDANYSNKLAGQLNNFFNLLQARYGLDKVPKHTVFMVTKIDKDELWNDAASKPSMELVKEVIGKDLFDKINSYFYFDKSYPAGCPENRCNFYGISAIGRYQNNENDQSWEKAIISNQLNATETSTSVMPENVQGNQNQIPGNNEAVNNGTTSQSNYLESPIPRKSRGLKSKSQPTRPKTLNNERFKDWFPINVTAPIKWLILNHQNFADK